MLTTLPDLDFKNILRIIFLYGRPQKNQIILGNNRNKIISKIKEPAYKRVKAMERFLLSSLCPPSLFSAPTQQNLQLSLLAMFFFFSLSLTHLPSLSLTFPSTSFHHPLSLLQLPRGLFYSSLLFSPST